MAVCVTGQLEVELYLNSEHVNLHYYFQVLMETVMIYLLVQLEHVRLLSKKTVLRPHIEASRMSFRCGMV